MNLEERIEILEKQIVLIIKAAKLQGQIIKHNEKSLLLMIQGYDILERKINRMQRDASMN